MATSSNSRSRQAPRKKAAGLDEEIDRIQELLRRLDASLADGEGKVPLKDLEQAVRTAGNGGKAIAQLRKFARELQAVVTDEDYERKRAALLDTLKQLGEWQDED